MSIWKSVPVLTLVCVSCGCSTDYSANYRTDCVADKTAAEQRLRIIADETLAKIAIKEKTSSEHPFSMMVQTSPPPPSEDPDGATSWGQLWFWQDQSTLVVGMMRAGKGTEIYTKKIKAIVEDSLSRNCTLPWQFNEQTQNFHFAK
jgi:hypothetical protein